MLLPIGGRVNTPALSPCPGGSRESFRSLSAPGPVTCFSSIFGQCHLQTVLFIEVFVQYGTGERELIASCPPVTLFTLMFTAPQFSIASRAPPLPANGELTVSIGLRPI